MNTLNEHTVHSHPAPACHHVLALQERSPMRHILPRESGTIPKEQGVSDNPRWERKEALWHSALYKLFSNLHLR